MALHFSANNEQVMTVSQSRKPVGRHAKICSELLSRSSRRRRANCTQPGKTISAHLALRRKKPLFGRKSDLWLFFIFFSLGGKKLKLFSGRSRWSRCGANGNYVSYKIIVYYHKLGFAARSDACLRPGMHEGKVLTSCQIFGKGDLDSTPGLTGS